MDTNEIMTNEEVAGAVTEEIIVAKNSCKGIKVAAGIGIAVVCGLFVYKYMAKPMIAKLKSRNENKAANVIDIVADPVCDTDEEASDEESEEA
ncbi:MAG: hypothetical protein IJ192_13785 [Clostridia bacterium]|nr:hypothetical protein [Clostridia bacterium]